MRHIALIAALAPAVLGANSLEKPAAQNFFDLTTRSAASMRTVASYRFDSTNLYISFEAEQPAAPIMGVQASNDVGFGLDDFVGVGIDTSGNGSLVYFFFVTPRGTRYQRASENALYRPSWRSTAAVNGTTWTATMTIPRSALHVPSRKTGISWRINFIRNIAALNEHYSWAFDPLMVDGVIGTKWPAFSDALYWPVINAPSDTASSMAVRRSRLEVYGLQSSGRERRIFQQSDGTFSNTPVRMTGADFSYAIAPTVNFAATLNPDFSNVDADQQTITPQEFRRSLVEYRPFFAQGGQFFNPNDAAVGGFFGPKNSLFYSPGIGRFDRGFKVEGTRGRASFGAMSFRGYDANGLNPFDDQVFAYKYAEPDQRFEHWADSVVTNHGASGRDRTIEAGVYHRNTHSGFIATSNYASEFGGDSGAQHSFNAMTELQKTDYAIYGGYEDISPHYSPLDGFTVEGDLRGPYAYAKVFGSNSNVRNWKIAAYAERLLDASGAVHELDNYIGLFATFKNGWTVNNLGPSVGLLRSYATTLPAHGCDDPLLPRSSYTGFPSYLCGRTDRYNLFGGTVGYRDGTPSPTDLTWTEGPYGPNFLHLYDVTHTHAFGRATISLEYEGVVQRAYTDNVVNSQWLRRVAIGTPLGHDATLSVSLRAINGTGGFAVPGVNVAAAFDQRFPGGDELYLNFGTPAAVRTLDRTILKFVHRFGAEPGT